jgi:AAA family ATP:ADP antiporter
MAELFGNVTVGLLFWQFANQVVPTDKAKRLYPIYGLWSNLGLIAAGLLGKWAGMSEGAESSAAIATVAERDFTSTIQLLCGFVTAAGIIILWSYYWINRHCLDGTSNASVSGGKKKKPKMPIGESLRFLMQSKYLGYITLMVLAYGITINLVEVSWKDSVKLYFSGDKASYNSFMSNLYIYTGISTMVLIVFSQNLLSLFGWRIAASITPIVSLITGGLFFAFLIFKDSMTGICAIIGSTPAAMAMWLGLMQNISTKASKYSLFDPTKEMAYIPLDEESKIKGKAAIDVIGGRAGKSGGGVINMTVGKFFSGHAFTTAIASMTVLICLTWWWAVKKLSVEYDKKIKEKEGA